MHVATVTINLRSEMVASEVNLVSCSCIYDILYLRVCPNVSCIHKGKGQFLYNAVFSHWE